MDNSDLMETSCVIHNRDNCRIWSSGIDYLTMTFKPNNADWERVEMICDVIAQQKRQEGHSVKTAKQGSYEGKRTSGIFWGERDDGRIVEASSDTAEYVAELIHANGLAAHTTRIDFQVTVRFDYDFTKRATIIYNRIRERKAQDRWASPVGLCLVETCGRGDSIAIGSRTSQCFRRIYDKTREQRGQVVSGLWRWEIEYKQGRAPQGWDAFDKTGSSVQLAKSIVTVEFTRLGLPEPWMRHPCIEQFPSCYHPTDNEKRLRWFARDVSKSYRTLCNSGLKDDALGALGYFDDTDNHTQGDTFNNK